MKTLKLFTTLSCLFLTSFLLHSQSPLTQENQIKLRAKMLNMGLELSNSSENNNRYFYFEPDSIRFYLSLDEQHPEETELIGFINFQWMNGNVKTMKINYADPGIADESYVYLCTSKVTKIEEVNTNNFYTFSYNFKGEMTAISYFEDGVQIAGDSLSYEPIFSKYHKHLKYDDGWKPYLSYYDVKDDITDMDTYSVDIYDDFGAKETYKYQFISFTNGQGDLFFKPLSFEYLLNRNSLEEELFPEHPSDNILGIPIIYHKFKLNEATGGFGLVEKSYAQYAQGVNVQRYSFTGNDSTLIFDGTLGVNIPQKIVNYTYKDNIGINHTGEYEYDADKHVVKEIVKEQNNIKSVIEYKYTPDDAEGLKKYEYTYRDGQGDGETEILEFAYADPLSTVGTNYVNINVFPTPGTKEINFQLKGFGGVGQITVVGALGRVMLSKNVMIVKGQNTLNISSLLAGIYIILIKTEEGNFSSSFVKI